MVEKRRGRRGYIPYMGVSDIYRPKGSQRETNLVGRLVSLS